MRRWRRGAEFSLCTFGAIAPCGNRYPASPPPASPPPAPSGPREGWARASTCRPWAQCRSCDARLTDYPAELYVQRALVNDLSLIVQDGSGDLACGVLSPLTCWTTSITLSRRNSHSRQQQLPCACRRACAHGPQKYALLLSVGGHAGCRTHPAAMCQTAPAMVYADFGRCVCESGFTGLECASPPPPPPPPPPSPAPAPPPRGLIYAGEGGVHCRCGVPRYVQCSNIQAAAGDLH